jgi:Mg2+-importing ATPase
VGWQALPLADVLKQLDASEQGLSSPEARRRLTALGTNEPSPAPRFGTLLQVVLLFINPLAIILLLASLVSAVLGEMLNAILQHERPDLGDYRKLDEIPFDFERRRLSVVVEREGERLLIAKGAPESILAICSDYEVAGQRRPFEAEAQARCEAIYRGLSAEGYRVLAVASRPVPEQAAYRADDERDLACAGFVSFVDPPLADAAEAIAALGRDGVRVGIVTGDNELVTRHICGQVGLDGSQVVLGDELERMTDAALGHVAE